MGQPGIEIVWFAEIEQGFAESFQLRQGQSAELLLQLRTEGVVLAAECAQGDRKPSGPGPLLQITGMGRRLNRAIRIAAVASTIGGSRFVPITLERIEAAVPGR